jgi:hypothetical protein
MAASVCQLVRDPYVRFPSSERSSAISPFRQVNEVSSLLQPLINMGKMPNATPSSRPAPQPFRPRAGVNFQSRNIFNGFLRVPVKKKNPSLNLI